MTAGLALSFWAKIIPQLALIGFLLNDNSDQITAGEISYPIINQTKPSSDKKIGKIRVIRANPGFRLSTRDKQINLNTLGGR
jgi:hypothetical protein